MLRRCRRPTTRPDGAALSRRFERGSAKAAAHSEHSFAWPQLGGVEHPLTGWGEECFVCVAELLVLPRPVRFPVVPLRPVDSATGWQHLVRGLCHCLVLPVAARLVEAALACLFGLDVRDGRGDPLRENTPT